MEKRGGNEQVLVSVVICSYNRKKFIAQAIECVLNQKRYFPIEIIVGDDGSTDGTRELLTTYKEKYPEIFVLLFQDKNLGIGGNWATTVKLTRGKYIALCDDDDFWHNEQKLQKQIEILENNAEIGLVHTDYRTLDEKGNVKEKQVKNAETDNLLLSLFNGKYFNLTSCSVFRKSLLDDYVNLDDYVKYEFPIQDWNTWMLIAPYTRFYHLPESTVTYRLTSNSVSRCDNNDYDKLIRKYAKEKIMYKYLIDKFPNDLQYDENRYDSYVNCLLLRLAYKSKDYSKAKEFAFRPIENSKSLQVRCAKNRLLFYLFCFAQKIKSYI
jgi:glycosyltransferase involved in cell wall biosynthesis